MIVFEVKDMTCGHCVSAITRAVKELDPAARVQVDLASHRVDIDTAAAPVGRLQAAIEAAGYTPVELAGNAAAASEPASRPKRGCCCG